MEKVAIVGLGLIGGSIGLAFRQHLPRVEVIGIARREETARHAIERGAATQAGTDLALVGQADLVILACPLAATAAVLEESAPHLAEGARVTDVGSVKLEVVEHARKALDMARNPFIGGHPMAGKEVGGIANAEASLFQDRPWVLTPVAGGSPESVFDDLFAAIRAIGALPVRLPADRHDRYVALVSHVPFLLSAAFLNAVGGDDTWAEASELASSGFRDFSRLGAGDPGMYAAISSMNRAEVLRAWTALHQAMDQFEAAIARGQAADLRELLEGARATRQRWAADHPGLT